MPEKILSVNTLSKKYKLSDRSVRATGPVPAIEQGPGPGEFWALRDVSFDLIEGDVMGIIGKNGSGKSTLLKILSSIIKPTSGSVTIRGEVTSILEIGSGFHPELTGMENIFFYGSMIGKSRSAIKSNVNEIIDFSGIGEFIHQQAKNYSNGMYLRLAMAVALHSDVKILLLDEVLSVGDAEFKLRTYDKIQTAFLNKGVSVLMASHGMNEITKFCNRCITLESGHIIFDGDPSDAVSTYVESSIKDAVNKEQLSEQKANTWHWPDMHTAPGNQEIRLYKVSLRPKEPHAGNKLYLEDDIQVEIQFWKLNPGMTVQISLLFYDMFDNPLFYSATINNTSGGLHNLYEKDTGLLSFICELPRNFLNKNFYSMQVRFGRDNISEVFVYKELFRFKISEDTTKSYYDIGPHVLRPAFNWRHEKIAAL